MIRPRFSTFEANGQIRYGLVRDGGIIDLQARHGTRWPTMGDVIADDALARLADEGFRPPLDYSDGEFRFLPPITSPEKIICVGVNYPDRNEEYKDGQTAPGNPSLFVRFPRSFVGHGVALMRPYVSPQLDYEGEVVLVIGKKGRHIPERDALQHIAGLSIANEGTIRDWVRHAKFNVTQGKNFDGTGSIGPWLVPYVSEDQIADIRVTTRVNGETRQHDHTSRMIFGVRKLISYISTFTTLVSGASFCQARPPEQGLVLTRRAGSFPAMSLKSRPRESAC